jgi:lipid-binding SYLF domain-containing protein
MKTFAHVTPRSLSSLLSLSTLLPLATVSCAPQARSPEAAAAAERGRAIERLEDATTALGEIARSRTVGLESGDRVKCVVVLPALVSGGILVGARHGHGVATCRTAQGWSGPAFVEISGGSAGLQLGFESADVVMMVHSARGMSHLFRSSFELGADTSAAAGPVGGSGQASTDASMTAEIVSVARSRGLFAGVELSGSSITEDQTADRALYPGETDVRGILAGGTEPPQEARAFLAQVEQAFPLR